jgi:hypothetical protein
LPCCLLSSELLSKKEKKVRALICFLNFVLISQSISLVCSTSCYSLVTWNEKSLCKYLTHRGFQLFFCSP